MLTAAEEDELTRAVLNRLFAAAGLQPMLDNRAVMEVNAQSCDDVWIRYRDDQVDRGPALASSDAELVELIRTLARGLHDDLRHALGSQPLRHRLKPRCE